MKVSVVIPAYNEEAILGDCLASVVRALSASGLQQEEYEIIVVNNASTDRTKEVALSFPGVQVIDEARKGITRAKQAGFLAAKGELVAHPDADTRMPESWISQSIKEFERDRRLVVLTGPYVYYDLPLYARALTDLFFMLGLVFHYPARFLGVGAMVQGGNYILRRAVLERAGGYDTNIEFYGEDFDLARRMNKLGKVKWTWKFKMYSSGRRLAEEGIFMTGLRYGLNNMASTFLKRPLTHSYRDIRPATLEKNPEK